MTQLKRKQAAKYTAIQHPPSPKGKKTKNQILLQAAELFAKHGYDGIGLLEIAKASGGTKGSLYYHFKGKRELYCECVDLVTKLAYEKRQFPQLNGATEENLEQFLKWLLATLNESPLTRKLLLHMITDHDTELLERLIAGPMGKSLNAFSNILGNMKLKKDKAVLMYFFYSICVLNDELAAFADIWLPNVKGKLSNLKAANYLEAMIKSW